MERTWNKNKNTEHSIKENRIFKSNDRTLSDDVQ